MAPLRARLRCKCCMLFQSATIPATSESPLPPSIHSAEFQPLRSTIPQHIPGSSPPVVPATLSTNRRERMAASLRLVRRRAKKLAAAQYAAKATRDLGLLHLSTQALTSPGLSLTSRLKPQVVSVLKPTETVRGPIPPRLDSAREPS